VTITQTAPLDLGLAAARIDHAHRLVGDIAAGTTRWKMTIPANPALDSDLILAVALADAEKAVAELAVARAALAEAPARMRERAAAYFANCAEGKRREADRNAEPIRSTAGITAIAWDTAAEYLREPSVWEEGDTAAAALDASVSGDERPCSDKAGAHDAHDWRDPDDLDVLLACPGVPPPLPRRVKGVTWSGREAGRD
jgi:hypothetical protein